MVASIQVTNDFVRVGKEVHSTRWFHHQIVEVRGHGLEVTYRDWRRIPWTLEELETYRVLLYARVFKNRIRRLLRLSEKDFPAAYTVLITGCHLWAGTDEEESRDKRWLLDNNL